MSKEKIKKIISCIIECIFIVFIVTILFKYMMSNDKSLFGYSIRIVVSESMEPAINKNSISIIKDCDIDDIKTNDIICYRMTQDIIHRVVDIDTDDNGNKIVHTKGDNNDREDQVNIDNSMIIGRIVYTFNGIAPIIEKYSIYPGNIDGKQLILNILMTIIILYLIVYFITWIIKLIVELIKAFNKNYNFESIIDNYSNNIEELNKCKEKLNNMCDSTPKNSIDTIFSYIIDRVYKVLISIKLKELDKTIKDIEKTINKANSVHNIVNEIDKDWNNKHNNN